MIKKPKKTNNKAKSISSGTIFEDWTTIKLAKKIDYITCKCICGVIKDVNVYSLTSGKSKSCGCRALINRKKTQERFN